MMAHHSGYGLDRGSAVRALMRTLPVHSYGRFLRNVRAQVCGTHPPTYSFFSTPFGTS